MSEAFAFFAGLLGVVVATAAFGAYVTREKSRIRQALTALCAVAAVAAVIALAQTVLPTAFGQGWVQEEIIFGIIGAGYAIGATRAILTHMAFGTPIAH